MDAGRVTAHLRRSRAGYTALVLLGTDEEFARGRASSLAREGRIWLQLLPLGLERLLTLVHQFRQLHHLEREAAEGELLADRYQTELDELNEIGRSLCSERDLDKLLSLILEKARYVTGADAGSIYVIEGSA